MTFFRKSFPKHEFIGEESVAAADGKIETFTDNPTWIIDPIDGTMNFVHSNPLVTISVALAINKKIVLGIVSAPCIGKTFTAIKGQGCKLNGQNVKVSECKELKLAQCILEVWPDMKETIQNHNFATIGKNIFFVKLKENFLCFTRILTNFQEFFAFFSYSKTNSQPSLLWFCGLEFGLCGGRIRRHLLPSRTSRLGLRGRCHFGQRSWRHCCGSQRRDS